MDDTTDTNPVRIAAAEFLVSSAGTALLAELASQAEGAVTRRLLRTQTPEERERLLLAADVLIARYKARQRYPAADRLFFTPDMLAQATSATIAQYHASVLAPFGQVADLGCGAGMDSLAFARAGAQVQAFERDPVTRIFAQANAVVRDVTARITFQRDIAAFNAPTVAVYVDPARRDAAGHRFSRDASAYEPPLDVAVAAIRQAQAGGLKLSPLLPNLELERLGGRIEFLSENRECKEACVWFGAAKGAGNDPPMAAVLLPERLTLLPDATAKTVRPAAAYLFDPDPAVIRAGALPALCQRENLGLLSADDLYLTGDTLLQQPRFASAYRILHHLPFHRKEVAALLKKEGYGQGRVVLKKHRARMEISALATELKVSVRGPGPEITLVLIREEKGHSLVICEEIANKQDRENQPGSNFSTGAVYADF